MATPADMRTWLRENGYQPGQRGRLHPDHIKAYLLAHQAPIPTPQGLKEMKPIDYPEPELPVYNAKTHKYVCGFCITGEHSSCKERVENGSNVATQYSYCACALKQHKE